MQQMEDMSGTAAMRKPALSARFHLICTCYREIMTQLLPHLVQDAGNTQILPFYSFAAVQRDPPNQHAIQSAKVAGRAPHTGMDGR